MHAGLQLVTVGKYDKGTVHVAFFLRGQPQALHGGCHRRLLGHFVKVRDGRRASANIVKGYPLGAADEGVVESPRIEGRVQVDQV